MEQTGDTAVNVDFALKENSAPVALLVVDSNGMPIISSLYTSKRCADIQKQQGEKFTSRAPERFPD